MAWEDLTELEERVFTWISESDFENVPWSSKKAAKAFKIKEEEMYKVISSLTKKVPKRIQLMYKDGSVRIAAE